MITFDQFYNKNKSVSESALMDLDNDLKTLFEDGNDLSPAQKKYREFMSYGMAKFGAESPADLSEEDKKKLFNWIKDNWDSDKGEPKSDKVKKEIAKAKEKGLVGDAEASDEEKEDDKEDEAAEKKEKFKKMMEK